MALNEAQHWSGRWCWTARQLPRPWNTYACFRKVVELPGTPGVARVRVSADARYTLYVNGRRVHHGPARCHPQFQSYDVIDLAGLLKPGRNVLAAIVHQFGVPTGQSVYRDASGFLLDGVAEIDGKEIPLHTPAGWQCLEATAWRKDVARLSAQLGFQEHFDADAEPAGWLEAAYPATAEQGWKAPVDLGPAGAHPWLAMQPRGIPLLVDQVVPFASIAGQLTGENARGYKIAEDVCQLASSETRKKDKALVENAAALLRDDEEPAAIDPPPDGSFVMLSLDLGQVRTGHVVLDIAQAAGDEIIDLLYTEDVDKAGAPALLPADIGASIGDRYRCRAGAQRWEPFLPKAGRFVTLVFRNVQAALKVRFVGFRQVRAGIEPVGSFECSDAKLNAIWLTGQRTLAGCMLDAYANEPARQQVQECAIARIQLHAGRSIFGDSSLIERCILQAAQSQAPDGSLQAQPPSDSRLRRPEDMMQWVTSLWDHHRQTGRTDLVERCLPALRGVMEFLESHESPQGPVGGFDGFEVLIDSADVRRADYSAALNLLYLRALRHAAAICQLAGEAQQAAAHTARATTLAAVVEKLFFDEKAGAWRDGFDPATGAPVEAVSQHANALAILLGLKPETHESIAREVLCKSAKARRGKIITATPGFYAYILSAMVEAGLRAEALDIIRQKWGGMIDEGATTFWESWDGSTGGRCAGASAGPVYHLCRVVLGITPLEAGWKRLRIAPFAEDLEHARGEVPTPQGLVRVEWEKAGEDQLAVRIDLPPGAEAEFVSPLGESRELEAGVHQFHT